MTDMKSPDSFEPTVFAIFGGAGDLTWRKLIPALFDLSQDRNLPAQFAIIAIDRMKLSDRQLRQRLYDGIKRFSRFGRPKPAVWKAFAQHIHYHQGDFKQASTYVALGSRCAALDKAWGTKSQRIFYMATPPSMFGAIPKHLGKSGLSRDRSTTRIVVEKPIGHDLASALELDAVLGANFDESQIFRIDHYLGKETVQNILAFRFANPLFEPIWNRRYVEHVTITVAETIEEKLDNIASALGKVDDHGHVAEDFRAQILGQLSEQVNYEELYRMSMADPTLVRTKEELAVALDNASRSRQVVSELFQDLDRFNLDEFRSLDDQGQAMQGLLDFCSRAAKAENIALEPSGPDLYTLQRNDRESLRFTTDRAQGLANDNLNLLGLDHPMVKRWLEQHSSLQPDDRGLVGTAVGLPSGVMTIWCVAIQSARQTQTLVVTIGLTPDGHRQIALESSERLFGSLQPSDQAGLNPETRARLLKQASGEILHRDLEHAGLLKDGAHYSATLLGWVELI